MTPAERAVIDAARAWAADYSLSENVSRLLAAVRALPRPLSEQPAELRVGDVLGMPDDPTEYGVLCNHPPTRTVFVVWNGGECCAAFDHSVFDRIISRGENIRG